MTGQHVRVLGALVVLGGLFTMTSIAQADCASGRIGVQYAGREHCVSPAQFKALSPAIRATADQGDLASLGFGGNQGSGGNGQGGGSKTGKSTLSQSVTALDTGVDIGGDTKNGGDTGDTGGDSKNGGDTGGDSKNGGDTGGDTGGDSKNGGQ
jgi:hypothetical protein